MGKIRCLEKSIFVLILTFLDDYFFQPESAFQSCLELRKLSNYNYFESIFQISYFENISKYGVTHICSSSRIPSSLQLPSLSAEW